MFEADKSDGDYHRNVNTLIFYKMMVIAGYTYPEFCKQMHQAWLRGDVNSEHGFYDYEHDKPTRVLVEFLDNAPYHHGIMVQIKSESKKGIAKILRRLGVTEIKWTRLDADIGAVEHRVEVPEEGSDWLKGHPNTKELQDSAYEAITEKKPELLQPPWRQLQYDWGPDDLPSRIQVFNIPGTSTFVGIENLFAYGKNYVGHHNQQFEGRSFKDIIDMLHHRWLGEGNTTGAAHFRMAHRFINQFIKDDHESGGPLEGKIGELVDAPTLDTMNEWRNLAGDVVYGDCINFNNGSADDDEDCD